MLSVQLRLYTWYRIVFYIYTKSIKCIEFISGNAFAPKVWNENLLKKKSFKSSTQHYFLQFFKYICLFFSVSRFWTFSYILNLRLIRRVWAPALTKTVFPVSKIRRPWDRLTFNMEIPILIRHLYAETAPLSIELWIYPIVFRPHHFSDLTMATEAMKKLQTAMKLGCEGTNYYDQWADTYEEVSHNLIQGLVITPI